MTYARSQTDSVTFARVALVEFKIPQKTYDRILITIEVIRSAAPREKMNELYQKINHYVYEIRMIEIDEYLYGMNRQKIDEEKADDIITNSESNAVINFWKGRDTERKWRDCIKNIDLKKIDIRANVFYQKALEKLPCVRSDGIFQREERNCRWRK